MMQIMILVTESRFMSLLRFNDCGCCGAACRNVVHRDLKLENLLLASPDDITKASRHLQEC